VDHNRTLRIDLESEQPFALIPVVAQALMFDGIFIDLNKFSRIVGDPGGVAAAAFLSGVAPDPCSPKGSAGTPRVKNNSKGWNLSSAVFLRLVELNHLFRPDAESGNHFPALSF
jgi:hypothetical protein